MKQKDLLNTMQIRRELYLDKLSMRAMQIERDMKNLQDFIKKGELWRINSLGEIQARGSELDVLCSKVAELNQLLEDEKEK